MSILLEGLIQSQKSDPKQQPKHSIQMKKLVLVGVISLVGVSSVFAQGTIDFRNRITGTLDVPVYLNGVGGMLLSGANFLAQLYYGTTATSLTPITDLASPFRTGAGAGYWNAGADSTRILAGIPAGSPAFLQVRAWDSTFGATYDVAKAAGGLWGDSNVFQVLATGGGGTPAASPAFMTGMQSFTLVPEPSTIALGILGAVALLFRRRKI